MATFGEAGTGSSFTDNSSNDIILGLFTLSEGADVSKISAHIRSSSGTQQAKALIYENASGTPSNLVSQSSESNFTNSYSWVDFAFGTSVALTSGDYWLGLHFEDSFPAIRIDSTGGTGYRVGGNSYASSAPDPISGGTLNSRIYSIYATYTAAGGTTYQASLNDSVGISDSLSRSVIGTAQVIHTKVMGDEGLTF